MNKQISLKAIFFIFLASVALAAPNPDTDKQVQELFHDQEISVLVNHLVDFIWLVNDGKTESSIDVLGAQTSTDLNEKDHAEWLKVAAKISSIMADVEKIELIGYQKISSAAYKVYFVGNGNSGPEFFDFDIFRYKSKWYLLAFNYNSDFKTILESQATMTQVEKVIVFER